MCLIFSSHPALISFACSKMLFSCASFGHKQTFIWVSWKHDTICSLVLAWKGHRNLQFPSLSVEALDGTSAPDALEAIDSRHGAPRVMSADALTDSARDSSSDSGYSAGSSDSSEEHNEANDALGGGSAPDGDGDGDGTCKLHFSTTARVLSSSQHCSNQQVNVFHGFRVFLVP